MGSPGIYNVLRRKPSYEEAMAIIDYIDSSWHKGNELTMVKGELNLKIMKLDQKLKIGFVLALGVVYILLKGLAQAVFK